MRILHTADWHLGKSLKGVNLLEDQEFIIDQIFDIISDQNIDTVLISGDIYDRAVPPPDAVELFDKTLNRFVERKLKTLIISGNHDSSRRLNYGSKIFADSGIYITAMVDTPKNIVLEDNFGEIYFTMIPFFESGEIRAKFLANDAERLTSNDANKIFIDLARNSIPHGKRSIALAHLFLTGGIESESERKFVGGSANVDAQIFSGYDYVALGHLHRPQEISAKNIRYAGSPLKYSFDEANHKKSVTIVDIDGFGNVKIEEIPLKPLHDVRIVEGNLYELQNFNRTNDFICARLNQRVINVQDKLANVFPNLLSVEFVLDKNYVSDDEKVTISHASGSILDYFADFFTEQTNEPLSNDYRAEMEKFLEKLARDEREA